MEKLLLLSKTKGGKYAENLRKPVHKKFSLAVDGYKNFFATAQTNNFIAQPYSGCSIFINLLQDYSLLTVNFFQDEAYLYSSTVRADGFQISVIRQAEFVSGNAIANCNKTSDF